MENTSFTYTANPNKYSDNKTEEEIMKFVRYAKLDSDALHNLRVELKEYDRRKTAWQCFKMFLSKL